MISLKNFSEIDNLKIENYLFKIQEDTLSIFNKKEKVTIKIKFNFNNTIKTLETIKKITGIKFNLLELKDKEILSYIEVKGYNKSLWNKIGKAVHKYNMIEAKDRIAVGISGGKDSLLLLNSLIRIKKISNVDFEIIPIHIHTKEDTSEANKIEEHIKKLGYDLQIIETKLGELVNDNSKEKNPCFLCGRIRRGILYTEMKKQGINKLALGHHKDDIVETFLMNIMYQGNKNIMRAAYFSDEHQVKIIRPLAFVEERDIVSYSNNLSLPILVSKCPYETSKDSKRLEIKNMIKTLSKNSPNIRSVILNSIEELL